MSAQVTLTLPDRLWERAEVLAHRSGRPVNDLLTETIELALDPLTGTMPDGAVESWRDEEVLDAAAAELPADDDQRLSELLERQQAGLLAAAERSELRSLMNAYQAGLLFKAHATAEAVRRGLREPVQP